MKLLKIFEDTITNTRWVSGFGLDDDQILAITTADHRGWERYYYNHKMNKFIPVILMGQYDINDFDCTKAHLEPAKQAIKVQDLDPDELLMSKVRAKMSLNETKKKSKFQKLQDNKIPLTDEERKEVMDKKATWNHGPNGKPSPAVWKSEDPKTGKIIYITNTHRAYNTATTLKACINKYHNFIKGTA